MLRIEIRQQISNVIGKSFPLDRVESTPSFADFTDDDLDDFRRLWEEDGLLCLDYLEFLLRDKVSLRLMTSFCNMVVEQRINVNDWLATLPATKSRAGP